jgi:hypothetical protein
MSKFLGTLALTAFEEHIDRVSATVAFHPASFDLRWIAGASSGIVQFSDQLSPNYLH